MASAIEVGSIFKIYAVSPEGHRFLVQQGNTALWGPGGSPDGVPANTPEKWAFLPLAAMVLTTGWKIIPVMILGAADGIDVSDGAWQLPISVKGVGPRHLSVTDLGGADLPAATSTTVEHDLGTGYTIPDGQQVRVGGGKVWMSAEDDT